MSIAPEPCPHDTGMEREFVGRLPVRVALQALSQDDLFQVLTLLGLKHHGWYIMVYLLYSWSVLER